MSGLLSSLLSGFAEAIATAIAIYYFAAIDPSTTEKYEKYKVGINTINGRIEAFSTGLQPKDLMVAGPRLTYEVKNQIQISCEADDLIGVLIDEKLGGLANETFNVIPMNPSTHETWKTKVTQPIYNYLFAKEDKISIAFTFIPFYNDLNATRPYSFAVVVLAVNISSPLPFQYIKKGFMPNPPKAVMSEADVPLLYSTGNITARGDQHCMYFTVGVGGKQSSKERVEMITITMNLPDDKVKLRKCKRVDGIKQNPTDRQMGNDKDVQGLLISEKLGGRSDDPYNVVPMSPRAVKELKSKVEEPISAYINNNTTIPGVWLNVIVMYTDSLATRPAGFIIRSSVESGQLFDSIYIPNKE